MFQEKLLDDGRVERLADATLTVSGTGGHLLPER